MIKNMGWREYLACIGAVACLLLIALPMLSRAHDRNAMNSCQHNLKTIGIALKMYANESRGNAYPPRSPIQGNWIVNPRSIYPEYLSDLSHFICPGSPRAHPGAFTLRRNRDHPGTPPGQLHPDCVSSEFYIYLGVAVNHDDMALALYQASHVVPPELLADLDLQVEIAGFNKQRDTGSGMPIMWERIPEFDHEFPHRSRGINILHMDGHVMFVDYDPYNAASDFPVTYISAQSFCRDIARLSMDCY